MKGQRVFGTIIYNGTGKGSNVYLYKGAFTSPEQLYLSMGHEYIHANLNISESFVDRKGREILKRLKDENETQENDTYYQYDDKDRLSLILPPGTNASQNDLIYKYTYDERDQVLTKMIPGKDKIEYRYNKRDLLSYQRDGYLRGQSLWYATTYDAHGRELESGFATQAGVNNTHTSAVINNEVLTESIYGTSSHEKDKIKTIKSKILGTSDWLSTTFTYDVCGRITGSSGNSIVDLSAGSELRNYTYDWMDNVLAESYSHDGPTGQTSIVHTYTYDKIGRQDLYEHKLNSGVIKQITNFDFDHKEQLSQLAIGPASQQLLNYTYKPNRLLASLNSESLSGGDLFYEELRYHSGLVSGSGAVAQQNGNIANVISKVPGDNKQVFGFQYDYLDRMDQASYLEIGGSGSFGSGDYFVDPTYDVRGNITSLKRRGRIWNGQAFNPHTIDSLVYSMTGNKITSIADHAPDISKFHGYNQAGASATYTYDNDGSSDGNGNVTFDPGSGATFTYNHLDLPVLADFGDGKTIEWTYDATGSMLRKLVKEGSTVLEDRKYVGEIEYDGNQMTTIYFPQGRVRNLDYRPLQQILDGNIAPIAQVEASVIKSDARVHGSGTVDFTAEDYIELEPDFGVEAGTDFTADIGTLGTPGVDWQYEFFINDHLGNLRVIFDESESILGTYNYYPFGMRMQGDWGDNTALHQEKYQYNGIEYVSDHGLDLNIARYRMLDPSIGRWLGVDPKAELVMGYSPYVAMMNSPVVYNDPDGDIAPLIIAAIAIGGGIINTASNLGNINSFTEGFNYFVTGAAGYSVAAVNPALGAGILAGGNLLTKGVYGDLPSVNSFGDVLDITASVALDFTAAYGTGTLVKGYSAFNAGGYLTNAEISALGVGVSTRAAGGIGLRAVTTQQVVKATAAQTMTQAAKHSSARLAANLIKAGGTSTATARSLGVAGERAVGIGSKTRIPSLTGTAKYRIPDGLSSTTLTEVKNVSRLSYTRQLRDFHMFSQQTGRQFMLYTRSTTTFSGPLQGLINQGQIIVRPIPGF